MKNELQHWGLGKGEQAQNHRYKERILVGTRNGRNVYRYIYDTGKGNVGARSATARDALKKKGTTRVEYEDEGHKRIRKETTTTVEKVGPNSISVSMETKISDVSESTIERGKKAVSNFFSKIKKKVDEISNTIKEKGKEWVEKRRQKQEAKRQERAEKKAKKEAEKKAKIEAEIKAKEEKEKKYKYIAKIKMSNGKVRYFYDQASLDAYYRSNGTETEKKLLEECGLKEGVSTSNEDCLEINERRDEGPEYQNNCYSCSMSFDLRRKGFDVDAIADPDGEDLMNILSVYDNSPDAHVVTNPGAMQPKQAAKELATDLKNQGDGSYGLFMVYWKGGGGHCMNYVVEDNKVRIIDTQNNQEYSEAELRWILEASSIDLNPGSVYAVRTDNLQVNENVLQYVKKDY